MLAEKAHRRRGATARLLAGLCAFVLIGAQVGAHSGAQASPAAASASDDTGFVKPFSGAARFERFAPVEITGSDQLHQPLGRRAADRVARGIGLRRQDAFTRTQFRQFIRGEGIGGNKEAARVIDRSVKIFINTAGHPLYSNVDGKVTRSVLGSYGLYVTRSGLLQSLANSHAPTRKANKYIEPGGYLGTWCIKNQATPTLRALYRSAYTVEAAWGYESQQTSGTAQLVANTKGGTTTHVGMSMVPSIWIVNFALLYVLKPSLAAKMPAAWAPIPEQVVDAIKASRTGQVRYSKYAALLD